MKLSGDAVRKNSHVSAEDAGDTSFIPGSERSSGVGNGNPLQQSCLKNSRDRGAWQQQFMRTQRVGHNCATEHISNMGGAFTDKTYHYVKAKNIL